MLDKFKPPKGKIKVPPKVEEGDETSALDWIKKIFGKRPKRFWFISHSQPTLFAACYCIADTSNSAFRRLARLAFAGYLFFIVPTDVIPDFL